MEIGEGSNISLLFEQQVEKWRHQPSEEDYGDIIFKGSKKDLLKLSSVITQAIDPDIAANSENILLKFGHIFVLGKKSGYRYTFQVYPQNPENPNDLEYKLRLMGYSPDKIDYNINSRKRRRFYTEVLEPTLGLLRPKR